MPDPAVPPEAYKAAPDAIFVGHGGSGEHRPGNERAWCLNCHEWCYDNDPCGQARCCSADRDLADGFAAGVAEGRRQAAEAIRTATYLGRPGIGDLKEWAARIAEGNTDAVDTEINKVQA